MNASFASHKQITALGHPRINIAGDMLQTLIAGIHDQTLGGAAQAGVVGGDITGVVSSAPAALKPKWRS